MARLSPQARSGLDERVPPIPRGGGCRRPVDRRRRARRALRSRRRRRLAMMARRAPRLWPPPAPAVTLAGRVATGRRTASEDRSCRSSPAAVAPRPHRVSESTPVQPQHGFEVGEAGLRRQIRRPNAVLRLVDGGPGATTADTDGPRAMTAGGGGGHRRGPGRALMASRRRRCERRARLASRRRDTGRRPSPLWGMGGSSETGPGASYGDRRAMRARPGPRLRPPPPPAPRAKPDVSEGARAQPWHSASNSGRNFSM
jgi:hypothetical protein